MNRRWLWILLGVAALCMVLFVGAAAGAGLTYFVLKTSPVEAAWDVVNNVARDVVIVNTNDDEAGVLVTHVEPQSPAADAGIQRGDIILAVDDQQVDNMLDVMKEIEDKSAGDEIVLTIQHCENTKEVRIELEEKNDHIYLGLQMSRDRIFDVMPLRPGSLVSPIETPAFLITQVTPGSPADDAGLESGMVITGIESEKFQEGNDLAKIIRSLQPGDEITFDLLEVDKEETRQIDVTLGENPDDPGLPYLGIRYIPTAGFKVEGFRGERLPLFENPEFQGELPLWSDMIPEFLPQWHEFPALPEGVEQAIVISSVIEDSPAEKNGLEDGDLITAVNGDSVPDPETFIEIIQGFDPGDDVTLTVLRNGEKEADEIEIVLGEHPDEKGRAYLGVTIGSYLRIEGSQPFHEFDAPFHFDFKFPWPEGDLPKFEGNEA